MCDIPTVAAWRIGDGGFFRKRTGTYIYMRMHDYAAKFLRLDADCVYGTNGMGGVTKIDKQTQVVPCSVYDFMACFFPSGPKVMQDDRDAGGEDSNSA